MAPGPDVVPRQDLAPDGKLAQEAFGVIRTAMEKSGQIALGRVVIGARKRILAIEPRGRGLLAAPSAPTRRCAIPTRSSKGSATRRRP